MSAIAGQTDGPNEQTFLREPLSTPGVIKAKKIDFCFVSKIDLEQKI